MFHQSTVLLLLPMIDVPAYNKRATMMIHAELLCAEEGRLIAAFLHDGWCVCWGICEKQKVAAT